MAWQCANASLHPLHSQGHQYCLCTIHMITYSVLRCIGNHETQNPILPSESSTANPGWMANLKEPSIVTLEAVEPGFAAGLSSLLCKTQGSSAQSMPTTCKLDGSVQPHRAVHWVWMMSSMFLMFLLIAICLDTHFNTYFIAVAFLPSLLGQQTAYWGLAFQGRGHDTQRRRANWFFKASKQFLTYVLSSCTRVHIHAPCMYGCQWCALGLHV